MPTLTRYVLKQILLTSAVVTTALCGMIWLMQALNFMEYIVNQGISVDLFLLLTLLIIPSLLLIILPIGLFCAVLYVYHRLRSDSELTVMEAAGLTRWQRAQPALIAALVVTLLGYGVSFFLMPYSYGKFKELQTIIRTNYASVLLQDGVFNSPTEGLTVFVRERLSNGTLKGILVHDSRNPVAMVTMMAEQGRMERGPQGQRLALENGTRQEMRAGRISFLNYDSYALDLAFAQAQSGERTADMQELYLPALFSDAPMDEKELARRRGEAHQRIIWPFYAFSLTLVAIGLQIGGEYQRRGQGKRVLTAVIIGTGVMAFAMALRGLSGQNLFYLLCAYANALLPVAGGIYFIGRGAIPGTMRRNGAGPLQSASPG